MASSTLTIVLPEPFKSYVEAHVADGSYASPADYVQQLILDNEVLDLQCLEDKIDHALQGRAYEITAEELSQRNMIELFRNRL